MINTNLILIPHSKVNVEGEDVYLSHPCQVVQMKKN